MARTFRRQRQAHPIAEMNVTNLIDLGFTLLIIFMIATPLINKEQTMPVNLPTTTAVPSAKSDTSAKQAISIDAKGNYYWNDKAVSFTELGSRLNVLAGQAKPPVIRIRADSKVEYQKVITLMNELQKRGLSLIQFDSQTDR